MTEEQRNFSLFSERVAEHPNGSLVPQPDTEEKLNFGVPVLRLHR